MTYAEMLLIQDAAYDLPPAAAIDALRGLLKWGEA